MLSKRMGPNKVFRTFFLCILHVKMVYKNLVTNIFSRDTNMPPQRNQISNILDLQPSSWEDLRCSQVVHAQTLKKWYAQKTVALFRDWLGKRVWYQRFLKREEIKEGVIVWKGGINILCKVWFAQKVFETPLK